MKEKQVFKKTPEPESSKIPAAPFFAPKSDNKTNPSAENGNLNSSTRSEMEHFFGENFTAVQIKQESLPSSGNDKILAGAQGEEVVMDRQISPESTLGKALLAHELAHVLQQRSDGNSEAHKSASDSYEATEREASDIGWNFLQSGKQGMTLNKSVQKKGKHGRFQSCIGSRSRIEPPAYLGRYSREALQEINDVIGNMEILGALIIVGIGVAHSDPAESAAQGGPGEDIHAGAEAARAIPVITRSRIVQIIDFLMLDHQNDLNEQELAFWRRIYERATGSSAAF